MLSAIVKIFDVTIWGSMFSKSSSRNAVGSFTREETQEIGISLGETLGISVAMTLGVPLRELRGRRR